jgi:uncharacterized protein (TIGR02996 family)
LCDFDKAVSRLSEGHGHWEYGTAGCHWIGRCADREFVPEADELQMTHRFGDRIAIEGSTVRLVNPAGETVCKVNDFEHAAPLQVVAFELIEQSHHRRIPVSDFFTIATTNRVRVFRYSRQKQVVLTSAWQQSGAAETHEDLIRAIVADPDNDGLRLIYADWLEERGDAERAAFIRLQVRIADRERTDAVMPNDADVVLEEKITLQSGQQWRKLMPKIHNVSFGSSPWIASFWRGFPRLDLTKPTSPNLAKLLLHHPADAAMVFYERFMSDREILPTHIQLAERLRSVEFHHAYGQIVQPQRMTDSPAHLRLDLFPRLRTLNIGRTLYTHDQLQQSLRSTTLHDLELLQIDLGPTTDLGGPILPALTDVWRFPKLKTIVFKLQHPPEPGDGLAEIAKRRFDEPYRRIRP